MDWIAVALAAVFCVARALERAFLVQALWDDKPKDEQGTAAPEAEQGDGAAGDAQKQ